MNSSSHKRRRDAAYRKGFADGQTAAATTSPLHMGSLFKPTVARNVSSTGSGTTREPESAASDDRPPTASSDARAPQMETHKCDENNVALGMAIAAAIIIRTWGQDTYAKEILGAAGLTTKTRLLEIGAEDYDLSALTAILDEEA
ncbi:hypothetical protein G6L87_02885 [Agrobacterium rhizogenes]|nr:hypothetical protein [Rhizobium rhizogenes]